MKKYVVGIFAITAACGGGGTHSPDAAPEDAAFDRGTTTFTAKKQGAPAWETAGWRLYTANDNTVAPAQVFSKHTYDSTVNTFRPYTIHQPPYDTEPADGLATTGFPTGNRFHVSEWTYPQGILAAAVIVPGATAPTGKTSDYASGPYIPKQLELSIDGDLYQDTTVVDSNFDSMYPTLESLEPNTSDDGWSHMTLTFGEDTSFIPGTPGHYRLHVHVYEVAAPLNGWQIDVPFDVE